MSIKDKDYFKQIRLQAIEKVIPIIDVGIILDIGCGDGSLIQIIGAKNTNKKIIGIDADIHKIKIAKKKNPNNSFLMADVNYMPFKPTCIDLVFAMEIIEHLNEPKVCLAEVRRVLVDKGVFLLSTPNTISILGYSGKIIYSILGWKFNAFDKTHINLYTPNKLFEDCIMSKFKIIEKYGFFLLPIGFTYPTMLKIMYRMFPNLLLRVVKNDILIKLAFITIVLNEKD